MGCRVEGRKVRGAGRRGAARRGAGGRTSGGQVGTSGDLRWVTRATRERSKWGGRNPRTRGATPDEHVWDHGTHILPAGNTACVGTHTRSRARVWGRSIVW